ncbi:MAG: GAF domain-containing protein [Jatrophihabitans sp.]|uniref:GAF domain-containing protein n=1 Tax=Jatrophihabitans sp. TaxID=1932789 RepID=UPI003F80C6D9
MDEIVSRAAELLPSGSAQISLLADAQLVVSVVPGERLDRPPAAAAGERWPFEDTVCALALRTDTEVRIPDTTLDDRVSSLGSVEHGDVATYLGSPIRDRNGDLFGVLCLYGPQQHDWTDAEAARLAEHAGAVAERLQRLADRELPSGPAEG